LSTPCTACVDIEAQTLGLHGITCIGAVDVSGVGGGNSKEDAAIYVNASNNSIEDVHVEAFWDAVEVGDIACSPTSCPVGNVVVSNLRGSTNGSGLGPVTNEVHICGSNYPNGNSSTFGSCNITTGTVRDVTILASNDNNGGQYTTSVLDDVTGTAIAAPNSGGAQSLAAIYALGYEVGGGSGGYSRFTTTPSVTNSSTGGTMVPTWGVGDTSVTGSPCNTPGSVYSNTAGASNTSVYVCTYNGSTYHWEPII
jgi:hypothetical protein